MPRYYINDLGGAAKVSMLVGFAPSNYGTTLDGLQGLITQLGLAGRTTALLSVACEACVQQLQGSSFLAGLNQAPTAPGVKYVVIETADDEVVTPYTNAFLPAAANVQNITAPEPVPAGRQRPHLDLLRLQRAPGHDQRPGPGQSRLPARPAPPSAPSSATFERMRAGSKFESSGEPRKELFEHDVRRRRGEVARAPGDAAPGRPPGTGSAAAGRAGPGPAAAADPGRRLRPGHAAARAGPARP